MEKQPLVEDSLTNCAGLLRHPVTPYISGGGNDFEPDKWGLRKGPLSKHAHSLRGEAMSGPRGANPIAEIRKLMGRVYLVEPTASDVSTSRRLDGELKLLATLKTLSLKT
jgi:hypothetical protein